MEKRIFFFGAGHMGKISAYKIQVLGMKVEGFIDNNPKKWGNVLQGLTIYSPEHLIESNQDNIEVIITIDTKSLQAEVIAQLQDMGFVRGKNLFTFAETIYKNMSVSIPPAPGHIDLDEGFSLVKQITGTDILISDKTKKYVYRVVLDEWMSDFQIFYERINKSDSLKKMLVPTITIQHEKLKAISPFVLQHDYIFPISYVPEWPPNMFKDYVLFMIDLICELDKVKLGLGDWGLYNSTFWNGQFIYIDFGSMRKNETSWFNLRLFINEHMHPLILMAKSIAKSYMYLRSSPISFADIAGYLSDTEKQAYFEMMEKCASLAEQSNIQECCKVLKEYVENIARKQTLGSQWDGYQDKLFNTIDNPNAYSNKQRNVIQMIKSVAPRTMLDLAGNTGWYSLAMANQLDYAITVDVDIVVSEQAYDIVKNSARKNIIPVCFNLITPLPATYGHYLPCTDAIKPYKPSAIDRFKCDMVLALAIIHHLTLNQSLSFEQAIAQLSLYTNKYLIIEFVDRSESGFATIQYDPILINWYTKERFELALKTKFNIIKTAPSDVSTRTLYLCEKIF